MFLAHFYLNNARYRLYRVSAYTNCLVSCLKGVVRYDF